MLVTGYIMMNVKKDETL